MDKTQSASHLQAKALSSGDEVHMLFLVSAASQQQARNGPFWRLELKDASASFEARIWNPSSQQYTDIPVGSIAEVEGRADSFRDRIQINVTRLRVLTPEELREVNIAAFLPASLHAPQTMLDEMEALCRRELTHEPWQTFMLGVLNDPDVRPRLLTAPAAKAVHHAWVGGLLEHTLSVATLCLRFCDQYPELDRQTLFVGALCHDLGKLWELSGGLANDYTDEGRLVGHINLCLGKLEPYITASGLSPDLALHLRHLVLSHHGQYEFASPRLPQTAEAFALHYADNIDAKLTQNRTLFAELDEGETGWSPYQKTLDRALYQAPRTPGTSGVRSQAHAMPSEERRAMPLQVGQKEQIVLESEDHTGSLEQINSEESDPGNLPPPWERPDSEPPPWEAVETEVLEAFDPWESPLPEQPVESPLSELPPWDLPEPETARSPAPEAATPPSAPKERKPRGRPKAIPAEPKPEQKPEQKPEPKVESRLEPRINQCSLL